MFICKVNLKFNKVIKSSFNMWTLDMGYFMGIVMN